jgi:hypothetical protein
MVIAPLDVSSPVDGFESVTNRIPTDAATNAFMRLWIEMDE